MADSTRTSATSLIGTWKLLSCDIEFQDTGERDSLYGGPARGYLIFTAGGRVSVYLEACDRPLPNSDLERAECHRRMTAYTGKYTVEDGCWTTFVDSSWNVRWYGTTQKRFVELRDGVLYATSDWFPQPLHDGRQGRVRISWERE